jgi:hypothetical protein
MLRVEEEAVQTACFLHLGSNLEDRVTAVVGKLVPGYIGSYHTK